MSQLFDALIVEHDVPIERLLLDPQNPRFEMAVAAEEATFDSPAAQDATRALLAQEQFGVRELAESIRKVGFLEVDNIVVVKFGGPDVSTTTDGEQKYIVIEGNRRIAAIKSILEEKLRRPISADVERSISTLDVLVLKPELCDMTRESARDVIQGVRHISGVRGWSPYRQAVALRGVMNNGGTAQSLSPADAAAIIGLKVSDAYVDLSALGVYEQMVADEEYGSEAKPRLFSYFVEAVKKRAITQWLQFDDTTNLFNSTDNRRMFYGWITPHDNRPQQIHEAQDVRKLAKVIRNDAALNAFSDDDEMGIEAALAMTSTPPAPADVDWEATLQSMVDQLNRFPASHLSNVTDISLLNRIRQVTSDLLQPPQGSA